MNLINSIQSKLHGSINPNSVQYIRQQDLKVQLDPSGTGYVEYSGQASIFEEAHVLNPQGENTTALAILQKAPSTLPFSLASQDQFTICLKYKVHDENKPLLGYYFTTSQYDLSMNNSVFLKDDTIQVSVYKASEYPIDYAITGDLTSTDLNGATLTGTISESYTSLDYLVTSGYGQFTFTLNGTSPLQQISATVLLKYTVTVVYSASHGQNIYAIDGSTDYYDAGSLVFNTGTNVAVDVSALNGTSYDVVFGTTIDVSSSIVNDTSIVNQIGDIIFVNPQQTLYIFDRNIEYMTKPLTLKNYMFKTNGTLTLQMTTPTVNYYLLNGGGGGGAGYATNTSTHPRGGMGGFGGKSKTNTHSFLQGSYTIKIGSGLSGQKPYNNYGQISENANSNSSNESSIVGQGINVVTDGVYDTGRESFGARKNGAGQNGRNVYTFGFGAQGGGGGITNLYDGYTQNAGSGGQTGGGNGSKSGNGANGQANTGSGGGGGAGYRGNPSYSVASYNGGNGGSGVVIIRLPEGKFTYSGSYQETTLEFP